jgi:hypothetical protein
MVDQERQHLLVDLEFHYLQRAAADLGEGPDRVS